MTPEYYYKKIVMPNFEEFKNDETNKRLAFNSIITAFQLRDFMFEHYKTIDSVRIYNKKSKSEYHKEISSKCPEFDYIADVANAAKHLKINQSRAYTNAVTSAGSVFPYTQSSLMLNSNRDGFNEISHRKSLAIHDTIAGQDVILLDTLESVITFWKNELGL